VITYLVRLGQDGNWQPYQRMRAGSPIEAAESVYGSRLDTVGSAYQLRALVRTGMQRSPTPLYDRSL
jgi:hypothetical protein